MSEQRLESSEETIGLSAAIMRADRSYREALNLHVMHQNENVFCAESLQNYLHEARDYALLLRSLGAIALVEDILIHAFDEAFVAAMEEAHPVEDRVALLSILSDLAGPLFEIYAEAGFFEKGESVFEDFSLVAYALEEALDDDHAVEAENDRFDRAEQHLSNAQIYQFPSLTKH